MDIFSVLKKRRQLLGITQQDLADISEVGLRTIKQIESGEGNPSWSTLVAIMDVLGLEAVLMIKNQQSL